MAQRIIRINAVPSIPEVIEQPLYLSVDTEGNLSWELAQGNIIGVLDDLGDVSADSPNLVGDRYLKFDSESKIWEAVLIDYVTSINSFKGDVLLTTNEIPETSERQYFSTFRFEQKARLTNLDLFKDVSYDVAIYEGNVLSWDADLNAWCPRPAFANLTLNDLTDCVVNYGDTGGSAFHTNVVNWSVPYPPRTDTVLNPETEQYETVYTTYTGLSTNDRTWLLSWVDSDNRWAVRKAEAIFERMLIGYIQDVEINYGDLAHGKVLQWDDNIYRWVAGDVVAIEDSDDVPEGQFNKYLTLNNLRTVSATGLTIGYLDKVDDGLRNLNPISHPQSAVLGWNPSNNQIELVSALTSAITTANVPEPPNFTQPVPIWDVDPNTGILDQGHRVYMTGKRVQDVLSRWGQIDWFADVSYPYGREQGMVLTWDASRADWIAGYPIVAESTDFLPEGSNNLYYTSDRVYYWTRDNIQRVGINYYADVGIDYGAIEHGQSLVFDTSQTGTYSPYGRWVAGYPLPLPITDVGDLLVGIGDNDFDYDKIPIGLDGQYLRVDYTAPNLIRWAEPDPVYKSKIQYPDLAYHAFVRSKDFSDTILYLGTDEGRDDYDEFVNPIGTRITIYRQNLGIAITHLTDKIHYNQTNRINPVDAPMIDSNTAQFTNLADGNSHLVVEFSNLDAYRPEQFVFQGRITGDFRFKVSVSDDGTTWDRLKVGTEDFQFELSYKIALNFGAGENVEMIDSDPSLASRNFYLVTLPLKGQNFAAGDDLAPSFWKYFRIELAQTIEAGNCEIYEINLYGWYNNNVKYHILKGLDNEYFLISGINNLEILLSGKPADIERLGLFSGFQCWLIADEGHTVKIYTDTTGSAIVVNNVQDNRPLLSDPLLIPPKSMVKIVFHGTDVIKNPDNTTSTILRWHLNVIGMGGGGSGSGDLNYYLYRNNHLGTQDVSTITGLHPIASLGNWGSLSGKPNFAEVALTGDYDALDNKPTLGTASSKDTGTLAGQVLELVENNKLPALDGSALTNLPSGGTGSFDSPATTKGDLIIHDGTEEVRFPVGIDGQVLIVDSNTPMGVKWGSSSTGVDASLFDNQPPSYYLDRGNHQGEIPVGVVVGLHPVALTGDYNALDNRPTLGTASSKSVGTSAGQLVELVENDKLPALDGSLLYNVASPLTTLGDLLVRANGVNARLPLGTNGQILVVDDTQPLRLKWADPTSTANSSLLNGQPSSFYLDLSNHTGMLPVTNISGLSAIALTGDYGDLNGVPNFAQVAFTGNYQHLSNLPPLGTASQYNVGTGAFNVIQLDENGNLPAVLANANYLSPTAQKGDLIVRGDTEDLRLPVGVENAVLVVDPTTTTGLKWLDAGDLSTKAEFPFTARGDLIVYDGTDSVSLPRGINGQILLVDDSNLKGLSWGDTAPKAGQIVGIENANNSSFYGKDSSGNIGFHTITGGGISSPLTSKGDLFTYSTTEERFPLGNEGQYLKVDTATSTGLVWTNIDYSEISNKPTLGTASSKDTGTLAGQVLELVENNKLPALDGSLLTGVQGSIVTTNPNGNISLSSASVNFCICNTINGSFTIAFPDTPNDGDRIVICDGSGSDILNPTGFGLNKVTLTAGTGHTIQGYSSVDIDEENFSVSFIFYNNRWSIYSKS